MKIYKSFLLLFVLCFALAIGVACAEKGPHEHSWGEWTETKAATCTAEGEETRSCACGETETQKIDKVDHTWSAWSETKEATCTAEGEETRTCSVCGKIDTRKTNKADHTLTHVDLVPATVSSAGVREHYECSVCHKLFNVNNQEVTLASLTYSYSVKVQGAANVVFAYNQTTGLFEGEFTLNTIWQTINFVAELDETFVLTYENTTFTGTGIKSAKADGAPWTAELYADEDDQVTQGIFFYSIDTETKYIVTYNATTHTLNVDVYDHQEATGSYIVLDGTTKVEITEALTIFDSSSQNIKLGEYSVAIDGDGKVIYASRSAGGFGGPGDGFYHDGSYAVVPGQVCGIFSIQEGFKSWGECSDAERNQSPRPWSLYTVVCPEGYHIITGSQSAMSNLIKALCGIDSFAESDNTLLEVTTADGSITAVVTLEINN